MKQRIQCWTVRNLRGQFIAACHALTAKQAIDRVIQDQAQAAAQFRSWKVSKHSDFVATVER